jgi:hypothetical protein
VPVILESALKYLEIHVLVQKLNRIFHLCETKSSSFLILRELRNKRIWSTTKYPKWLVFEAEGNIQIRPEQYLVARHLLDNPSSISQLNMGLGKTRVILPLIVIQLTKSRDQLVRAIFLSNILREAVTFLQGVLTASVLRVRLFRMPFCRDIDMDKKKLIRMKHFCIDARNIGGLQVSCGNTGYLPRRLAISKIEGR